MLTRVLVLHAPGTNRDREAALAARAAGGDPEIVHLNQLLSGERRLLDYGFLVLPGGFSYGDDLGAGTLWALALRERLGQDLARFVAGGRPVLGICNGFQALVKAGLLPGGDRENHGDTAAVVRPPQAEDTEADGGKGNSRGTGSPRPPRSGVPERAGRPAAAAKAEQGLSALGVVGGEPSSRVRAATLARNRSARFECRWVYLRPEPGCVSAFTRGLTGLLYVPVAHGEGRFEPRDPELLEALRAHGQIALTYVTADGVPAGYPANPNGSAGGVAGVTNEAGNVLGLMPHPEDHVFPHQHPRWTRGESGGLGLTLFVNGIRAASEASR